MGEHGQHHDAAAPARTSLTAAQAREMTAGLREAMDDVRRSVAVLAARVRDAHTARVWLALGRSSWESYCAGEFGISRAQAYRLLEVARSLAAIQGAVTAGTGLSHTRDRVPHGAVAFDYGLSQRALTAVAGRTGDVAELITDRLAALAQSGPQALNGPAVRAVVRQAVHDVRTAQFPAPADPPGPTDPLVDPVITAMRAEVENLFSCAHQIGELMLEVAPAYVSDVAAEDVLTLLCHAIGEPLDYSLAARRYALSGDRRALDGMLL